MVATNGGLSKILIRFENTSDDGRYNENTNFSIASRFLQMHTHLTTDEYKV